MPESLTSSELASKTVIDDVIVERVSILSNEWWGFLTVPAFPPGMWKSGAISRWVVKASEHQSSIIPCILPIPSILRLSLAAGFFQRGTDGSEDGAAG